MKVHFALYKEMTENILFTSAVYSFFFESLKKKFLYKVEILLCSKKLCHLALSIDRKRKREMTEEYESY